MSVSDTPEELQVNDAQSFGFIAEIVDKAGKTCGMGILIASDRIMTCAHVINLAMKRSDDDSSEPSNDLFFEVRFPFLTGIHRKGSVLHWYAPAGKSAVPDCCVLCLTAPLGVEVQPARFARGKPGEKFRACRRTGGKSPLNWVHGKIGLPTSDGKHQVSKQTGTNGFLIPGCSGGPVVSEETGHVLGMVVWANQEIETGHVTPTLKLEQAHGLLMAAKLLDVPPAPPYPTPTPNYSKYLLPGLALGLIGFLVWLRAPDGQRVFPKEFNAKLKVTIAEKRPPKAGWMLIELTNPPKSYGAWKRASDHIIDEHEDVVLPGEGKYHITCSLHNPPGKPRKLQATATLPSAQYTYSKLVDIKISAKAIVIDYSKSDRIDTL